MRIRPVGAELFHADRRTDMSKLIVAFRNFVNVPKCTSTYAKTQEMQAHKRNVFSFHLRICYSCPISMKLELSQQIFEKSSNINFHENPSSGSRVFPYGRTDRRTDMKLIVAFRNFARVPKNRYLTVT